MAALELRLLVRTQRQRRVAAPDGMFPAMRKWRARRRKIAGELDQDLSPGAALPRRSAFEHSFEDRRGYDRRESQSEHRPSSMSVEPEMWRMGRRPLVEGAMCTAVAWQWVPEVVRPVRVGGFSHLL